VSRSEYHFVTWRYELYGSVSRSMFTVFRCFTDGCSSLDGTPLIPYMWDVFGPTALLFYVVFTLIVTFGLFNLIAAIFVENTIERSKINEQRLREARAAIHGQTAVKLQKTITWLCTECIDDEGNVIEGREDELVEEVDSWWSWILMGFSTSNAMPTAEGHAGDFHDHHSINITPKIFKTLMQCKRVIGKTLVPLSQVSQVIGQGRTCSARV
jgi:hypothetical protein